MESTNKDLIQSFKMTTIRSDFGIYAQRTIVRLIEATQFAIEGRKIGDCIKYEVTENLWGDKIIKMPLSAILPESDKTNHTKAKKELKSLVEKSFEYETASGSWVCIPFLSRVEFDTNSSIAQIRLAPEIWSALLDFSKGFRRFELDKALSLKSVYSLRLYQLMSGQDRPISYTLEALRKMFGLVGKYSRPIDFIKRVITPAKAELDKVAPYSFDFKPIYSTPGGAGRPSIVGITFFPYFIPAHRDKDLESKKQLQHIAQKYPNSKSVKLNQGTKNYLIRALGFTEQGIKSNLDLFLTAQDNLQDFDMFLRSLAKRSEKVVNLPGYVVNVVKSELDKFGIEY